MLQEKENTTPELETTSPGDSRSDDDLLGISGESPDSLEQTGVSDDVAESDQNDVPELADQMTSLDGDESLDDAQATEYDDMFGASSSPGVSADTEERQAVVDYELEGRSGIIGASFRRDNTAVSVLRYGWDKAIDLGETAVEGVKYAWNNTLYQAEKIESGTWESGETYNLERDPGFNVPLAIDEAVNHKQISEEDRDLFIDCETKRDFLRTLRDVEDVKKIQETPWYYSVPSAVLSGALDPVFWAGGALAGAVAKTATPILKTIVATRGISAGKTTYDAMMLSGVANFLGSSALKIGAGAGISAVTREAVNPTMTTEEAVGEVAGAILLTGLGTGVAKFLSKDTTKAWMRETGAYLGYQYGEMMVYLDSTAIVKGAKEVTSAISSKAKSALGISTTTFSGGVSKLSGVAKDVFTESVLATPYLRSLYANSPTTRRIMRRLLQNNSIVTDMDKAGKVAGQSAETRIKYKIEEELRSNVEIYEEHYRRYQKTRACMENGDTLESFNEKVAYVCTNTAVIRDEAGNMKLRYLGSRKLPPEILEAGEHMATRYGQITEEAYRYKVAGAEDYMSSEGVRTEGRVLRGAEAGLSESDLRKVYKVKIAKEEAEEFARKKVKVRDAEGNIVERVPPKKTDNITSLGYFTRKWSVKKIQDNEKELLGLLRKAIIINEPAITEHALNTKSLMQLVKLRKMCIQNEGLEFNVSKVESQFKSREIFIEDNMLEKFLDRNPVEVLESMTRKITPHIEINRAVIEEGFESWEDFLSKLGEGAVREIGELKLTGKEKAEAEKKILGDLKIATDIHSVLTNNVGRWDNPKVARAVSGVKTLIAMKSLGSILISSIVDISNIVSKHGFGNIAKAVISSLKKESFYKHQDIGKLIHASEVAMLTDKLFDSTMVTSMPFKRATSKFYKATLLPYWNEYWKRVTNVLHWSDIVESCVNRTAEGDVFLTMNRITEVGRKRIAELWKTHGEKEWGNYVLPMDHIKDTNLEMMVYGALTSHTDATVISRGAGDLPMFLREKTGSLLFQFRGYMFAMTNNVLMPLLLNNDSRSKTGQFVVSALMLGTVTQALRRANNNVEVNVDDPEFWTGVLRDSGVMGWIWDAGETVVSSVASASRGKGAQAVTRISPVIGTAVTGVEVLGMPFKKELAPADWGKIKSMIPGQNLIEYQWILSRLMPKRNKY